MLIVLTGFMGSGKSSFFRKMIANSEALNGIDLDDFIFKKYGGEFPHLGELIYANGMQWFREREYETLKESLQFLKNKKDALLCLGGGTLESSKNILLLGEYEPKVLWLNTSWEVCWDRIKSDFSRPLVKKGKKELSIIFDKREFHYRQNSDLSLESVENITKFSELKGLF